MRRKLLLTCNLGPYDQEPKYWPSGNIKQICQNWMHCRNPDSGTTETPSCAASFQVTRTSVKKLKPRRGELVFVTNTSIVGNISGNLEICRIAKIGKFFYKLKSFRCSGKLPKTWIHSRQPGNFASNLDIISQRWINFHQLAAALWLVTKARGRPRDLNQGVATRAAGQPHGLAVTIRKQRREHSTLLLAKMDC